MAMVASPAPIHVAYWLTVSSSVLFEGLADLPVFNPDDDREPVNPAVHDLRHQIAAADVVVFFTPEYAGALPGSFKNLIDWTVGSGELYRKPVASINVAAQGRGAGAQAELAKVLGYVDATVIQTGRERLTVDRAAVGPDGTVADAGLRNLLSEVLRTIVNEVRELSKTHSQGGATDRPHARSAG